MAVDSTEHARAGTDDVGRLFDLSRELLSATDRSGRFVRLNPAWERVLGWSREELLARSVIDFLHPDDVEGTMALAQSCDEGEVIGFENRYRCQDGGYRWLQWNARRNGDTWYGVARDVTETRLLQRRVACDPLTGLPNRAILTERMARALARMERRPALVAVLFIDLDRLKLVNDGQGHDVGDRLLRAVAARLTETVRGTDTVSRLGGDEFAVLVEEAETIADVVTLGRRITATLHRPFEIDGHDVQSGTSVGIATTSSAAVTPDTLLGEADVAMYRAKASGGNRFELFDDAMRHAVQQRVCVEDELRHAVERRELLLHYQPIVNLPETSVAGCEALVRWQHPTRGLLPPDDFIPLAEETGLIGAIGAWVLHEACRQGAEWRRRGWDLGVTVNVSTRQLDQPGFAHLVEEALRASRLPPPSLCLEITETAIMDHAERVAPVLAALRRRGVRVAMDDFGSGYSSLTYLKVLPLDIIKIDRSFVVDLPTSAEDRAIVGALLRLAEETDLSVVAEGVETEALHAELVGLNCRLGQGFLYDQPKPAAELALDGYSSRVRPGVGDVSLIREFMRQIGIPARIGA